MKKKKPGRKISAPRPDKLPGEVKYRPPKGQKGERPLERIRKGRPPQKATS